MDLTWVRNPGGLRAYLGEPRWTEGLPGVRNPGGLMGLPGVRNPGGLRAYLGLGTQVGLTYLGLGTQVD